MTIPPSTHSRSRALGQVCEDFDVLSENIMRTYDEQTELRRYLWTHFTAICSSTELRVYKANIGHMKASSAPQQDKMLRKMFGDWDDPLIATELANGFDSFSDQVLQRIGRESPELFYINRCEMCDRIVATPKACICSWCGHEWFARRDEQNQIAEVVLQRIEQIEREQAAPRNR